MRAAHDVVEPQRRSWHPKDYSVDVVLQGLAAFGNGSRHLISVQPVQDVVEVLLVWLGGDDSHRKRQEVLCRRNLSVKDLVTLDLQPVLFNHVIIVLVFFIDVQSLELVVLEAASFIKFFR